MKFICSNRDEDLELKPLEVKVSKPKVKSERADLIGYFHSKLLNKDGQPFKPRVIAIKLAHLTLEDLYYLKSVSEDLLNRQGLTAMSKHFWWSIRYK